MTWFKVDDNLHSHSKVRKVLADEPAALALWTVAGSWSSDNLTDGLIPDHQLPWLMPSRADELARMLVTAGLWRRVKGGYQFHQWTEDGDGTKRNPTRKEVENERRKKAEAGRKGGLARARRAVSSGEMEKVGAENAKIEYEDGPVIHRLDRNQNSTLTGPEIAPTSNNTSSTRQARASASATAGALRIVEPPTRPVPKGRGGTGESLGDRSVTHARSEPPSPRCEKHLDVDDPPPCGPCGDARRARARWDIADSNRRRTQPQCRLHRGQPAHNCGPCRAEALVNREIS